MIDDQVQVPWSSMFVRPTLSWTWMIVKFKCLKFGRIVIFLGHAKEWSFPWVFQGRIHILMGMSGVWRTVNPSKPESWHIVKRLGLANARPSVPSAWHNAKPNRA
uniref:Uncharacterized protein n=1 Tax=Populus trichocarpa TaxID=3694 RepID=B9HHI4_POPTR